MKAKLILSLCFLSAVHLADAQWTSKFVHPGKDGRLEYASDESGNIIPDFSGVGYYHQRKAIPVVPVVKTLTPTGTNDDLNMIQQTIDEVSKMDVNANGFRGAILLKKGTYRISGTIKVGASGIVLRGEGEATK